MLPKLILGLDLETLGFLTLEYHKTVACGLELKLELVPRMMYKRQTMM